MRGVWVWLWLVVVAAHGDVVSTNIAVPVMDLVAVPTLTNGDVVMFLGDSITAHGDRPAGWIELMQGAMASSLQHREIELVGRGAGGMKLRGLRDVFDRYVRGPVPTLVVIEIGMNDLLEADYEDTVSQRTLFELGFNDLIWRSRRKGIQPVLVTHTLYGEKQPGTNRLDKRLDAYSALIRAIGRKKRCPVIELRKPFLEYVAAHNPENRALGVLTTDGAHFNLRGHRFMADLMLKAFGAGALVETAAAVDPDGGKAHAP